jgi:hypothetical protein
VPWARAAAGRGCWAAPQGCARVKYGCVFPTQAHPPFGPTAPLDGGPLGGMRPCATSPVRPACRIPSQAQRLQGEIRQAHALRVTQDGP